jgi:hypothetical protein
MRLMQAGTSSRFAKFEKKQWKYRLCAVSFGRMAVVVAFVNTLPFDCSVEFFVPVSRKNEWKSSGVTVHTHTHTHTHTLSYIYI